MNSLPGKRTQPATQREGVLVCDHCGDRVIGLPVVSDATGTDGKVFCCGGCKAVYELLRENGLCDYYAINPRPGLPPDLSEHFEFLDDQTVQHTLLDFRSDTICAVTLSLPQVHCSSCIWLIEHLYKIDPGVIHSRVDFLKKNVAIQYNPSATSLRGVVELLTSLGYTPDLEPEGQPGRNKRTAEENSLYYRIGVAGFCFGNIMLLSFPEYLSIGDVERELRTVFGYASLILSLPVVLYCASGYFLSAFKGLRSRTVTLDVPIALGIAVVFLRSLTEIMLHTGVGFLDSLSGLVFFLLLGKLFQNKTYDRLNFDRNYRSYFPIAVTMKKNGIETTLPLERLEVGDKILVRNNEIIPADAYLLSAEASIDYSFVTGESTLAHKTAGDLIFAGGRQSGSMIEVQIAKEVSQSYLTQLWNADVYAEKSHSTSRQISDAVGKYFTVCVLCLATLSGIYWLALDPSRAMNAFTGVLIIACPCALALSTPFTMGTAMRIFGRNKCYVKNTSVIESLASVDAIVFDKTGTLTATDSASVRFVGDTLTARDSACIASLASQSAHPVSRMISAFFGVETAFDISGYHEETGQGIEGLADNMSIRLGSYAYTSGNTTAHDASPSESRTYVALDGIIKGYFAVSARYRSGIGAMLDAVGQAYDVSLVSGDNDSEQAALVSHYGKFTAMHFFQSPMDKLRYVQSIQAGRRRVAMIGDGLNDAGALRQSDVGIAVTDDIGMFSPACDAIMDASILNRLPAFMSFARSSVNIVYLSFAFSFLYNAFGLAYAMRGSLSPVMAAVLMPLSSISVALFATLSTRYSARRRGL